MIPYALENTLRSMFHHWWGTILLDPRMIRIPAMPSLVFVEDPENKITAQFRPANWAIEVSGSFLRDIQGAITQNAQMLTRTCLSDLNLTVNAKDGEERLLRCLLDLLSSFVLLHELFHLFCGHIDELKSRPGNLDPSLSLDDAYFGMTRTGAPLSPAGEGQTDLMRTRSGYFLEVEADNTALQWLMGSSMLPSLPALLSGIRANQSDEHPSCIADLEGNERILAFRTLFAASWLVLLLAENKRPDELRIRFKDHPLPAARLLAAMFTLMEQFVELADPVPNESGRKIHVLSDEHIEDMKLFLRKILGPVLKAPWPVTDQAAAAEGLGVFSPPLVKELRNILLQKPLETKPGHELEEIEELRNYMNDLLQAHRYFTRQKSIR
jgi:hypothetical protein